MQQTELGLKLTTKCTRKRESLVQTGRVVPWLALEGLIAPQAAAPGLTKNASGQRDPEMHQTKNDNQWYVGLKCALRRGRRTRA